MRLLRAYAAATLKTPPASEVLPVTSLRERTRGTGRFALVVLALFVFSGAPNVSHASIIGFTFSSVNFDGNGGNFSGSGDFGFSPGSQASVSLQDLSAFRFTQRVGPSAFPGFFPVTFSYGLGDLSSFSLDFGTGAPSLSLNTNAVAGSDPFFIPQSFSVRGTVGQVDVSGFPSTLGTVTLDRSSVFAAIVDKAVIVTPRKTLGGTVSPQTISATFQPNFGLTLEEAAMLGDYNHFNWLQIVSHDPHPPDSLPNHYIDPPPGGGPAFGGFADNLPFYWDETGPTTNYSLSQNISGNILAYSDTPTEGAFVDDERLDFVTSLVGVRDNNTWHPLDTWTWSSNYNGTVGGIGSVRRLISDTSGGSGGVFDVMLNVDPQSLPSEVQLLMIQNGGDISAVPGPSALSLVSVGLLVCLLVRFAGGDSAHRNRWAPRSRVRPS